MAAPATDTSCQHRAHHCSAQMPCRPSEAVYACAGTPALMAVPPAARQPCNCLPTPCLQDSWGICEGFSRPASVVPPPVPDTSWLHAHSRKRLGQTVRASPLTSGLPSDKFCLPASSNDRIHPGAHSFWRGQSWLYFGKQSCILLNPRGLPACSHSGTLGNHSTGSSGPQQPVVFLLHSLLWISSSGGHPPGGQRSCPGQHEKGDPSVALPVGQPDGIKSTLWVHC